MPDKRRKSERGGGREAGTEGAGVGVWEGERVDRKSDGTCPAGMEQILYLVALKPAQVASHQTCCHTNIGVDTIDVTRHIIPYP